MRWPLFLLLAGAVHAVETRAIL
ncbi:MAG: hypothetical protein RLZZ476_491, partial [Verrucomicrobiota bacterium]